jgi:fermentation-respiration switch protein FrsA (DUF1100 family)
VVHGENDTVVPISLGERLYGLVRMPKRFVRVAGAGHNDLGTRLPRRNGLSPSNPHCDGDIMGYFARMEPTGATYQPNAGLRRTGPLTLHLPVNALPLRG